MRCPRWVYQGLFGAVVLMMVWSAVGTFVITYVDGRNPGGMVSLSVGFVVGFAFFSVLLAPFAALVGAPLAVALGAALCRNPNMTRPALALSGAALGGGAVLALSAAGLDLGWIGSAALISSAAIVGSVLPKGELRVWMRIVVVLLGAIAGVLSLVFYSSPRSFGPD